MTRRLIRLAPLLACVLVLCGCGSVAAPARPALTLSEQALVRSEDPVTTVREVQHPERVTHDCLTPPGKLGPGIAPSSGASLTVKVGAEVYVELVEAEKYLSWSPGSTPPPPVFPWLAPASSDAEILRRVTLCRQQRREVSSLPLELYGFRALRPGSATLTAPLAPAWRRAAPAMRRGLQPYRATVIVTG